MEKDKEKEDIKIKINDDDKNHNQKWSTFHEEILIDWCDKAMCYRYLHSKCNRYYSKLSILFTIPVIFMSTLTGVANFAQDRIPEDYKFYYTMGVGSINIIAGFITTVAQFLKVTQLNESHRVSSMSWEKLSRNIKVELSKSPDEREGSYIFIKRMKESYDLLIETSPDIKYSTILEFNKQFKNNDFYKPEICDSLISVKDSVYKNVDDDFKTVNNIKERRESQKKDILIDNFINEFKKINNRVPTTEEIYENMEEQTTKIHLNNFMGKFKKKPNDDNQVKETKTTNLTKIIKK